MQAPDRQQVEGSPRRVLLVGWDAADWQMIHPLIEQGLMPTLKAMMNNGAWGNLATMRPILSPMLWNSIATGKRPEQHGVHGFTEPNPDGPGVRPVQSTSRKCKAIWNHLTHSGLRSHIIGWYASHPAEPINGVMVSNQFEQLRLEGEDLAPPAVGCISPEAMTKELAPMRVTPREIDGSAILPFVPDAQSLLNQEGHRLGKLQHLLAQTATIHATATQLLAADDWDFAAVYYEGIDRFGHEFMEFHPPKMEQVQQQDFEVYQHCMVGAYRFHDMMLQTLLDIVGDDTAVVLISDHGYYNDHLRPDPREGKSGPVDWHRPFGVFAATGPGINQGTRVYGAGLLDITPTLLHLVGLPAAHDMPGRVLAEVLEQATPMDRIESWEEVEGVSGMHPPEYRVDPLDSLEAMQQLIDLGYVERPGEDDEKTVRDTVASNRFNLIQSMIDCGQYKRALEEIGRSSTEIRESSPSRILEASCCLAIGQREHARKILGNLAAENPESTRAQMMLGTLELADGNRDVAMEHFQQVLAASPRLPGLHNKLGSVLLEVGRIDESVKAFQRALEIDGDSPLAYVGIARAKLESGDAEAALEHAMIAAGLVHHLPRAHYVIGRALNQLGRPSDAIEALRLCVKQAPRMSAAHQELATSYRATGEDTLARESEMRAKQILGA